MSDEKTKTHSPAVEDYIKAIYKLTQDGHRATTKALASALSLGQGSVSGMLGQLAKRGLASHKPYYGATLTEAGQKLALDIIRRHRLLELFLVKTLGYGWDEVDHDAERLEHAVSAKLIERIDRLLDYPAFDPHGDPIPNANGEMIVPKNRALKELTEGEKGIVLRVTDGDPQFLHYLRELNIGLGSAVEVLGVGPFGTMQVSVEGVEGVVKVHLAREATERVFVEDK